MKNKILICTLAAALAACVLTGTKTYADNSTPMPVTGSIFQRIAEKLNLTDEQ